MRKVASGSKPESPGSLKAGQAVSVSTVSEDGRQVAVRVEVNKVAARAGAGSKTDKTSSGGGSGN